MKDTTTSSEVSAIGLRIERPMQACALAVLVNERYNVASRRTQKGSIGKYRVTSHCSSDLCALKVVKNVWRPSSALNLERRTGSPHVRKEYGATFGDLIA